MRQQPDPLSRFLQKSLLFHLALIATFTVKAIFFPAESLDYGSAMQVDLVALPDKAPVEESAPPAAEEKSAEPLPKAPPPAAPQAASQPIPKQAPQLPSQKAAQAKKVDSKNVQKDALAKLAALRALDEIKSKAEAKSAAQDAKGRSRKGNAIMTGGDLKGLSRSQFQVYRETLNKHVKSQWNLPRWLADANLKARALVLIDSRGVVTKREIQKSSGNPTFDSLVLAAIDRSSPFPQPPDRFVDLVAYEGIILGFPE